MKSKSVLIVSVLLFALVLSACGSAGVAAPAAQPPVRTITVSGEGKVILQPDIAYINIGVHTEKPTASDAVAQNSTDSQAVIDALKSAGVSANDIQTTNYNIYQNNQTGPDGKVISSAYDVDNTVYVTVRDITKMGNLLDAAVKAGANNVNNIQFDLADKTKALSDARASAVKAAKAEADELAAAAGVTLGDLQSMTLNENTPSPIFYGKGGGVALASAAVPVNPGTMEITSDVTMVYGIK